MTHGDALREIERLEFRIRMLEGHLRPKRADKRTHRCSYCGRPSRRQVCAAHRDVALLDPQGPNRRVAR